MGEGVGSVGIFTGEEVGAGRAIHCKESSLETGFQFIFGQYLMFHGRLDCYFVILRVIDGGRAISKTAGFFLLGHCCQRLRIGCETWLCAQRYYNISFPLLVELRDVFCLLA